MRRKGFIFWDVLMSLSLMGMIALICFPILIYGTKIYTSANTYSEINYLGEYIFERLSSHDDYCSMLFTELEKDGEVVFEDLEDYYLDRYECRLISYEDSTYLWKLKLSICSKKGNEGNVEFEGSVPRQ